MKKSTMIKKRLQKRFPNEKFFVRIKHGDNEHICIYTSMIEELTEEDRRLQWEWETGKYTGTFLPDEVIEFLKKIERNKEKEKQIKEELKDFEFVNYCPATDQILPGGNTYIFVYPMERYEQSFKK